MFTKRSIIMKKTGKLAALAAAFIISCLTLVSCGEPELGGDDPAVGSWTMTGVEYMGQTLSTDDIKESGAMDEMPTFKINEDGTCIFKLTDKESKGRITAGEDNTYEFVDDSDTSYDVNLDEEGSLRIKYDDMSMVMIFSK